MTYLENRQQSKIFGPPAKERKAYSLKRSPIKKKVPVLKTNIDKLTHPELVALAQVKFNAFIRFRDCNKQCITGGGKVEQAGHYLPVGSYSGVRFDEMNAHGQSKQDNCFKHGNANAYREALISMYGLDAVKELEFRAKVTRMKKWSRDELKEIIGTYTEKVK